ncbi:MAG: helix-hairpin-helix domain-containing protein [Planctomycetaceae bacterium]|nr:helix-hairpin-helix domain-containing protein [Planctomycetaceae bacterium]
MATPLMIDLRQLGRGLDTPLRQIQATVELLDEGNTVPFITRYRKDQTGGLDEEQVREIQGRLTKARLLADRKQTILRSIESQGKLTDVLTEQILAATTTKRLEDLYLPYRPKKLSLATLARSRGLEALAQEILEAAPNCNDLDARAADFISTDRQVPTAADALLGAGHILAEQFSEHVELRGRLRELLQRSGALVTARLPGDEKTIAVSEKTSSPQAPAVARSSPAEIVSSQATATSSDAVVDAVDTLSITLPKAETSAAGGDPSATDLAVVPMTDAALPVASADAPHDALAIDTLSIAVSHGAHETSGDGTHATTLDPLPPTAPAKDTAAAAARRKLARQQAKEAAKKKRDLKKKKLEEKRIKDFADYFDYREEIRKIPPHRVLAINRGERAKVLRVRVECDLQAMINVVDEMLVPPGHPHADYLRGCARDALSRLILPSLEREIRRELTDRAETHAVSVFAKNLRNLLLQPPVHNHRLLAVDPGFRSGCKLAALDQFGNLLGQDVIYLVGKRDRRDEAREKVLKLIQEHQLTVVVIGNGTACRQTEDFVAELIEKDLKEQGVAYVIVNEAGASVYSTSRLGREEFPQYDAVLRGAISIGRRLQDPLSELVKIDAASIGVGLYQHDVKAKHLRTSLDEVVESCVNYVGVDVNTASPALLRYVSGLNQLTARRLYEYRQEHGPFRNRGQLREVPGVGDATFVQAAGFLKILDGDNPLDATWIHPESYAVANKALERLNNGAAIDLRDKNAVAALAEPIAKLDLETAAKEFEVGLLTLKDIVSQLTRPGRDPREDLPAPVFKRGVINIEDLTAGMELTGTVLNVVDFGCFVDIGMHQSGLVHVSRLADKFVRDPHDVVAVGDIVKVWVTGVDKERHRVSLTMIRPGSEQPKPPRRGARPSHDKPTAEGEQKAATASRPPRPAGQQRPPRPAGQQRPPREGGQQRPPRSTGERPSSRPQGRGRPQHDQPRYQPRPRPKPVVPITDAMKTGKEPMRTFGDLVQFYQQKSPAAESPTPLAEKTLAITEEPQAVAPESPATATPAASKAIEPVVEQASPVAADEARSTPEQADM